MAPPTRWQRLTAHLSTEIEPTQAHVPLALYCFMTGFVDAITFTAVSVWCGFQTGNTIELSLALARTFDIKSAPGPSFRLIDKQSLTSITTFLFGAFLGRIGDKLGNKTRRWLVLGTFIQTLFTMAAAILLWKNNQSSFGALGPTWTKPEGFAALGFASASMGLQGIMGKRVNTQFATTIVLTTVWCELMADPKLFSRKLVKTRDLKIVAVSALFIGGFVGRALLDKLGDAGALGVGTGIRFIITLTWFGVQGKGSSVTKAITGQNKV
ncbi:hypothetical protein M422DRAFT_180927 [Sphaerobolus stellatus SS14]|uniref:DUF1275 domain protein n=1 Tax=Sphaerobolus stellatus (strain SS14) TaxID=990650 RepID=A0A0C9UK67_SPHS4|nr:hypothetical protein M422DRAFT_180927 [Sphaerobolus stellatus SS14]